ncbi:MAG: 23S rRNA (guanosine(2251)-2'-O)-methyltransferase RlmB [Spirochaetia bacterium]|jgi:23S rRNA (guanosine2251-2'-O)-methyltransferase|nr:23S rRNA (guanosine(2251)-2'-O)-methyltransferase RlmB [Spirochaetia bacterium]
MSYISGLHGILEQLRKGGSGCSLLVAEGQDAKRKGPRVRDILDLAVKNRIPLQKASQESLDAIDPDNKGIILHCSDLDAGSKAGLDELLAEAPATSLVLMLDHIEDPQNLGAILRSADAFGAYFVVVPTRRASPMSDAVARASAGASAWVPLVTVQNLADALAKIKKAGFWTYGAEMGGEAVEDCEFAQRSCLVLGNEGEGLSRLLTERVDSLVSIPMQGHVDSLNVSVAAAILMHEFRRSRRG